MARNLDITSYEVAFAAAGIGFNEWKANIHLRTTDPSTICDIRFIDGVDEFTGANDTVVETGISTVYQHIDLFFAMLHILQSEKPLQVVFYETDGSRGGGGRVLIQNK